MIQASTRQIWHAWLEFSGQHAIFAITKGLTALCLNLFGHCRMQHNTIALLLEQAKYDGNHATFSGKTEVFDGCGIFYIFAYMG